MTNDHPRSPLAMVVLALLVEAPMHAYRIRSLLVSRDKGSVVNIVRSNSLYQVIDRLERDGLIGVRPEPGGARGAGPSRRVYEPTSEGRSTLSRWMGTMLSTPAREFPEFPAVLAMVATLTPSVVRRHLEARISALEHARDVSDARMAFARQLELPRVLILEEEYQRAMAEAELAWVRGIAADLRSGELSWTKRELARHSARYEAPAGTDQNS